MRQANIGRKFTQEAIEKIRTTSLGRKHTQETKDKLSKRIFTEKQIQFHKNNISGVLKTIISPDGEIIEFYNTKQFCKKYLLTDNHVYSMIKGKRKSHKGWVLLTSD